MLANHLLRRISVFSSLGVPIMDLTNYVYKRPGWEKDCQRAAELIREYGLLYAYDPRVDHRKNETFLDQMEQYFDLRSRQFDEGVKNLDVSSDPLPVGLKFSYN